MEQKIQFTLNDRPVTVTTDGERALLWVLRTDLGLTGAKYGCGQSQCGTCTVIVNNEAIRSCNYPVKNVAGKRVLTIEGLALNGRLHPLQKAFMEHGAVQCGFCTPGMILNSYSLLLKNPTPSREQVVKSMEYNLCRCGSYSRVERAVLAAAAEMKGGEA
ncbi:MAG: (2Fe-2S)-binding protein [Acidobacteria bacterium]|nr:(2Fe-2S)-binding protein [Acidobacteriota bacterium]